ncbi:unnamed protein product [Microthlaspi erraticum]|uniref:Uncharacterized protein n=1 Tax=Microthlaspi erraticum TaxID=1685480 RepID=A0A6D2J109_9BRAS|nr:unnamed protein product [Microthlaspi erraticum]
MDFIKTSSLRALIELTFQRNWNGFIWMSRKGVIAKRVKAAPDGYIENQRPNAQTGWPRNECSALGQNRIRPTDVSAKVQTSADHAITTRETLSRGRPSHNATPRRARPSARAGRTPRGRATHSRTTADASVRAGKTSHVRPRNHRPNFTRRPSRPTEIIRPRPFRLGQRPDCPADRPDDRPNAAVDPKPFLKPNPHNSSPKPAPT